MSATGLALAAGGAVLVLLLAALTCKTAFITAAPDEWLLQIRDGRLAAVGIGISVWRRPGDVVARFTSTMQRVGFTVEALTAEHLKLRVEGFILWAVDGRDERPFLAFRSLGLANLLHPPADLKHPKHLLTTPQHKAFQQVVGGTVQRHTSAMKLGDMLGNQDAYVAGLSEKLHAALEPMGAELRQVQVLELRPVDQQILRDLSSREEERIHEEATLARLETGERVKTRELEIGVRQAREEAQALREREQREQELLEARLRREETELVFTAEKRRRQAQAERDAALALLEVEERKSPELRAHELGRLAAETLAKTVKVTDARWITVGGDSPLAGVGALLTGLRELISLPK